MKPKTYFVPFCKPSLNADEENAVLRVMRSGWLTTGKETLEFEKEFAAAVDSAGRQTDNAVQAFAVNSATSGLMLAMDACGLGQGSKILTTPYTFVSTATAARHIGAEIAYADIEKDTYSIDPLQIRKKLEEDPGIKAIVPVHIAGNICNMEEICRTAEEYGVKVIEDAAHAFPSVINGQYAGTLADAGVFSFYATKTITTAEGGMICTRDKETASRIQLMRLHGIDRPVWDRYISVKPAWEYDVTEAGWKCNMPDILAAIGRVQLKKARGLFEKRAAIAKQYNAAFKSYDFLTIPPDGSGNAWHLYILRIVPEKLTVNRDVFAAALTEAGVGVSVHFIPHYKMTYFKNRYGLKAEDYPNTEKQFSASFSIPLWPDMDQEMITHVIDSVIAAGKKYYAA